MQFLRSSLAEPQFLRGRLARWIALAAIATVLVGQSPLPVLAQNKEAKGKDAPAKNETKSDKKTPTIPPSEDLELSTGDKLQLTLTYYPGVDRDGIQEGKGKRVIPIVLLHGWKQSRNEFKSLAAGLQKLGFAQKTGFAHKISCAVIVPDLRGHGDSTRWIGSARGDKLDAAKMPPAQFTRMVTEDMKAIKDFLWEKNNAGELNIDKLCIVGSEMGASVALDFAAFDADGYGYGSAFYGPRKLGRFVKALVLISPRWTMSGLPIAPARNSPVVQSDIAMMFLVGKEDNKAFHEARRIHGIFKPWHPEPTDEDKNVRLDKQTLFSFPLDTKLQGTKLLDGFDVENLIADFVYRRLVKSDEAREWTWKQRKSPTE
jgi:pimeloyl-ACP methyl ester carboxylesterase